MPYDSDLAERVRQLLKRKRTVTEKRMFGGIGFLHRGNLLVAVWGDYLIVRLGPEEAELALLEPNVRPFDITGKAMTGWVMVASDAVLTETATRHWLDRALRFVSKLPRK